MMDAITNNLIVTNELKHGALMAERYAQRFDQMVLDMHEEIKDTPPDDETYPNSSDVIVTVDSIMAGGLDIRTFQKHVIETYSAYKMAMYDDELVQDLIDGVEDADIHDVIEMIKEFKTGTMNEFEVISIIPIDLKGTMAFLIGSLHQR